MDKQQITNNIKIPNGNLEKLKEIFLNVLIKTEILILRSLKRNCLKVKLIFPENLMGWIGLEKVMLDF